MGLLDDMAGKAMHSAMGYTSNPLAQQLLQMINNQPGGLAGLVQNFHQKGLGELVNSWISPGQNMAISTEQVHTALGSDVVKDLADKAGVSPDAAGSSLAQLLPMLVDKLTPNGQMPQKDNLLETGMNLLKSFERTGTNG